jgi:hypothetical protein
MVTACNVGVLFLGSRMKPWKPPYKTETQLCAAFIAEAKKLGWVPYAETCGWDILLVNPDGVQVGVQAKMRLNAAVMKQVLPSRYEFEQPGPDFRAVLVPVADQDWDHVLSSIGVILLKPEPNYITPSGLTREQIKAWLNDPPVTFTALELVNRDFLENRYWNPAARHPLPEYIPDVPAGASSPIRLTEWKISALRICAEIEINGSIRSKRMGDIGCDPRRWRQMEWVSPHPEKRGEWIAGPNLRFPAQHPDVYKQILEEARASVDA